MSEGKEERERAASITDRSRMKRSRSLAKRPSEVSELNANSERIKKKRPSRFLQ